MLQHAITCYINVSQFAIYVIQNIIKMPHTLRPPAHNSRIPQHQHDVGHDAMPATGRAAYAHSWQRQAVI